MSGRSPLRGAVRRLARHVRRTPFAVSWTAALWVLGALTGSLVSGPPPRIETVVAASVGDLPAGRWWTVATAPLFAGNLASYLAATALILVLVGLAEATMGTLRTVVVAGIGQAIGVSAYFAVAAAADQMGVQWLGSLRHQPLIGPYVAAMTVLLTASACLTALWRRRIRLVSATVTVTLVLYVGAPQSVLGVLGLLLGLLLGRAARGPAERGGVFLATARERRTLLALVVGVFATGPLLAGLAHAPAGPLAELRVLIVNPVPTAAELSRSCSAAVDLTCPEITHSAALTGPGSVALALAPLAVLLVCAWGMREGSRAALWAAVAAQAAICLFAAAALNLRSLFVFPNGRLPPWRVFEATLPGVLVPLVLALVLVGQRRFFVRDVVPRAGRRAFAVVVSGLVAVAGLYAVVWFAEGNADLHPHPWWALWASLVRMFVPYPFPARFGVSVEPDGPVSGLVFGYGGAVFWAITLVGLVVLIRRGRRTERATAPVVARAAALVRVGGDSLSRMTLWPGASYWFTPDGTAAIAYQRHHGVALTIGGPIGARERWPDAALGFIRWCADEALVPCLYSVPRDLVEVVRPLGFGAIGVADETVLPIEGLTFSGKRWQNVRTALNRAERIGVRARWYRWPDLPHGARTRVREISEAWVAERALPELGFTLGGVAELADPDVALCLAVDDEDRVHGVVSWLPVHADGQVVSWTLDFMRRDPGGFNGVMEFLIASAVLHFRDEVQALSLSGSPLAVDPERAAGSGDGPTEATTVERLQGTLRRLLEPAYGFAALAAFKSRFAPAHRTWYLAYPDPLQLPRIARALAEAYAPDLTLRQAGRLLRGLGPTAARAPEPASTR
ncbi:hypothetical protein BKD30_09170 [Tersicoccus phoenicis]|uniref:Phosphatidylglycerol lysyltransferase C-terminal domain-containing protein n=1 Tax=Tersicoccus phoenicis TaxID=554083 RepID=A0A1R1L956_9MICC|nr:DUF2156 domain-containing protein [Tersicoccus phoenicis]OMH24078.1 hypothetical protein BKD30_09170 [Tersicoccus phoenicis]